MWSATYMLIIISSFLSTKERKVSMPFIAGALNFSWELNALIRTWSWMHFLWTGLDIVILAFAFVYIGALKKRLLYAAFLLLSLITLYFVFELDNGMLASFVIDIEMAIMYVCRYRHLSRKLQIPIAATKLLGDLAAGIFYCKYSGFVIAAAVIVFLLNAFYLDLVITLCVKNNQTKKRHGKAPKGMRRYFK